MQASLSDKAVDTVKKIFKILRLNKRLPSTSISSRRIKLLASTAKPSGNFGDSSSTTDIAYEISVSFTTNSGQYYVYTMKLLDLDNQLLDPKVSSEPDCELVIPTAEWDNIMKNVASMGESLRVICNETLNIEAHGLGGAGKTQIGGKHSQLFQ